MASTGLYASHPISPAKATRSRPEERTEKAGVLFLASPKRHSRRRGRGSYFPEVVIIRPSREEASEFEDTCRGGPTDPSSFPLLLLGSFAISLYLPYRWLALTRTGSGKRRSLCSPDCSLLLSVLSCLSGVLLVRICVRVCASDLWISGPFVGMI